LRAQDGEGLLDHFARLFPDPGLPAIAVGTEGMVPNSSVAAVVWTRSGIS